AEKRRVPLIVVVGDKEVKEKSVAIRDRRAKRRYSLSEEEFIKEIKERLSEVHF
ncbi:MAG: hypothetical protein GXO61_02000, partial [Epsilonproteobacteria bacterium]|nr:hypothetical protein [Campylobacterota bacterium]